MKNSPPIPALSLALFEPDIPQNAGAMLRLAACLGLDAHIIEPCGFLLDDRKLRRAGMDYLDEVLLTRHLNWAAFCDSPQITGRKVLATRFGAQRLDQFEFRQGDCIIMGRESAGVPEHVHDGCDARVVIPMHPHLRSLNVAQSAAIITYEAARQLNHLPDMAEVPPKEQEA